MGIQYMEIAKKMYENVIVRFHWKHSPSTAQLISSATSQIK